MKKQTLFFPFFIVLLILSLYPKVEGMAEMDKSKERGNILMRIYFVPFAAETFAPLTMGEMEERNLYEIWFMKEHPSSRLVQHPFVSKLETMLRSKPADAVIDNSFIRLKVVLGEEVYFVDRKGVVLDKNNNRSFRLSKTQMIEIEKGIMNCSGVIDVRTSKEIGLIK